MKAKDFMTKNVVTCTGDQTVSYAAKIMSEKGFSVMPIIDETGGLVGIVTESDFVGKDVKIPRAVVTLKKVLGETHYEGNIQEIYERAKKRKLSKVMSKNPITVGPDDSLNEIVQKMATKNLKRLPVVENGKIVGIITRKDLIKAFNQLG